MEILLSKIHDNKLNPRTQLGNTAELAENIREQGLRYPILLTPCNCNEVEGEHYRILDGQRRVRAVRHLCWQKLTEGQFKVYENLTEVEEVKVIVDTNIEREQYTPAELYRALELKKRYGVLRETAGKVRMAYSTLRDFMSTMRRLDPAIRERVVFKNPKSGQITLRQARLIAQVNLNYQRVLADADLSYDQLKTAVELIQERSGTITPEEAVQKAKLGALAVKLEDKVVAAFITGLLLTRRHTVSVEDLVQWGFTRSTARRTIDHLTRCRAMSGGTVDPNILERFQGVTPITKHDVIMFVKKFYGRELENWK